MYQILLLSIFNSYKLVVRISKVSTKVKWSKTAYMNSAILCMRFPFC